ADLRAARGRADETVLRRGAAAPGGGRDPALDARAAAGDAGAAAGDRGRGGGTRGPLPAARAAQRDRVRGVVRGLVRAHRGGAARRAGARAPGAAGLMFDALARLADGQARRVALLAVAFFLLAA